MGFRFLAVIALILILAFLVRNWWRRLALRDTSLPPARLGSMVRCRRCGTYVPRAAAVERDGLFYCSEQHADGPDEQDEGS